MSSGGAFGGSRGLKPKPPEKGVFPLDHFGECKEVKEKYMACLRSNRDETRACQSLAEEYLQCRMDRDLMAKQDLRELGLGHEAKTESTPRPDESASAQRRREARGFVAGESQKERRAAPGQDLPSFKRGH
ncbi:COX19 [Auxenochlorella protothecoides x Auxenochlorella symbiontica]